MVLYAPYRIGRTVKAYDGKKWVWHLLPEKAQEAAKPDLFVWDDRGTLKIGQGGKK